MHSSVAATNSNKLTFDLNRLQDDCASQLEMHYNPGEQAVDGPLLLLLSLQIRRTVFTAGFVDQMIHRALPMIPRH